MSDIEATTEEVLDTEVLEEVVEAELDDVVIYDEEDVPELPVDSL